MEAGTCPSCRVPYPTSPDIRWVRHDSRLRRRIFTKWFSSPVRLHRSQSFSQETYIISAGGPLIYRKMVLDELWHDFFSDPSQWWDHRVEKANPRYPDFKHKKTQKSLWIIDNSNPPWVEAALAEIVPGTLQSNIFSWNVRLRRYVKAGKYKQTVELFRKMQREGMIPDKFTFVPVLNACSGLSNLEEGRRIHVQLINIGFDRDVYVATSLVDMYAKCRSIEDARSVFNKMPTKGVVAWTVMILGLVKCGQGKEALVLFNQMQREGVDANSVTFVGALNACASIQALDEGKRVHKEVIDKGYESDIYVASSLVDMYAKCGLIEDAQLVFNKMPTRGVVAWSAMILGYVRRGLGQEALELSRQMQREGVDPDPVTFVGVLKACASSMALEEGRRTHEHIICKGYESDVYVASSLVDMYAKCGSIEDARDVFNRMPTRGAVVWSSMILGYVKCGQGQNALQLFWQMQSEGVASDAVTFVGVLSACSSIGILEEGRRAHLQVIDRGYESDVYVASSLVDMYAKCGSIEDACRVFNKMPTRGVVLWNAMLAGYGLHGYAKEALNGFIRMCQDGVEVNGVTFVSLLSACSHGGLVVEGIHYFESMCAVFNISPTVEHYACVVDLLGRAGHLQEAEDLIRIMPCEPGATVWVSLLGSCRAHGNVEMGERGAKGLLESDPRNAAGYVLLSNMYAAASKLATVPAGQQERQGGMAPQEQ